jgi:hypothetical protein
MGCTVLPRPAYSPDLALSDCHLFGPVKDALRGRHFVGDKEWKQSFRYVSRNRDGECYIVATERLTQRWQKCAENDTDFVEK